MTTLKNKLGQQPAFPSFEQDQSWNIPAYKSIQGMSQRLWIATQLLHGCLRKSDKHRSIEEQVRAAYYFTDELLKQEKE